MDTKMTVSVIIDCAEVFERKAAELRGMANQLKKTGDFSIASEAVSVCHSTANLRTDLLVTRPIREYQREINRLEGLVSK